jgi:hypothetical protein
VPDQKLWWWSRAVYLRLNWGRLIKWYGTQKEAPSLVLRHGKGLGINTRLLLGIGLSGFLLSSLNTPLCFDLLSMGLWLRTRNKMCGWGYMGDSLCLFCRACQETQARLFFSAASVDGFGKLLCRIAQYIPLLLIVMRLYCGVLQRCEVKAWTLVSRNSLLVLLFIICGCRETLCYMVKLPELKRRWYLESDGK